MAWLNSDDMYYPWALLSIASIMSSLPAVEWVTTLQPGGWDINGFPTGVIRFAGISCEAFLDGMFLPPTRGHQGTIQQESTFWRRSLWEKIGGSVPTTFATAADFDLWAQFIKYGAPVGIPFPIAGFRFQPKQKTTDRSRYLAEARRALDSLRDELNWRESYSKTLIRFFRLHEIPVVKRMVIQKVGYCGRVVHRAPPDQQNPKWLLTDSHFV